ncbi:MAG TPA: hypothetical protein VKG24_13320 [Pseudolabrys sp.]|jgi:hypothetical protein|nr:hypothetical protein [Pseudolabrys sp.]
MKNRHPFVLAVAAVLALSSVSVLVRAEDSATQPTNPGYVPNTGQINPGTAQQPSSQSTDFTNNPTPEEVRAALMAPISRQPSTGDASTTTGSAAAGTPQTQDANVNAASSEPPPSGPIGSFGQTIPAKFSKRNDTLDHVPVMALPLPLNDEQRKKIYDAVMADNSQPVAGVDALKPTSELSPHQALNGMRPLPESVSDIDGAKGLYYLKGKDRALLIDGPTRTVVDQIRR